MAYPRKLRQNLIDEINKPDIVVLTGMRQVGKTTIMRDIYDEIPGDNKVFLDLENPLNRKIFEEDNYDNILLNLREFYISPKKKTYIFIDEIQLMPGIVRSVKYLYDHYQIKFFLTGSSSYYLKNLFPESLAGRKIIYELYPLTFQEFLIFKEIKKEFTSSFTSKARNKNNISYERYVKLFDEYITYGGFPGVVLESDIKRKTLKLADIFTSYFEKDVRSISDFQNMNRVRDTILLLADRSGSKFDVSKFASEIGVSRNTIYSYTEFLEKTYFIKFLRPYSKNINGEVRGAKKVYLCDSGLLNYLTKLSNGSIFETAVYNLLQHYGRLNYYQKYRGSEIDFILNGKIGFEVKQTGNERDVHRLGKIVSKLGLKDYYLVVQRYNNHERMILAQDI